MKGNFQVRFLEGGGLAIARLHSTEFGRIWSNRRNVGKRMDTEKHSFLQKGTKETKRSRRFLVRAGPIWSDAPPVQEKNWRPWVTVAFRRLP